jgi:hypothetical protein
VLAGGFIETGRNDFFVEERNMAEVVVNRQ